MLSFLKTATKVLCVFALMLCYAELRLAWEYHEIEEALQTAAGYFAAGSYESTQEGMVEIIGSIWMTVVSILDSSPLHPLT